jgi:hypothetical protein
MREVVLGGVHFESNICLGHLWYQTLHKGLRSLQSIYVRFKGVKIILKINIKKFGLYKTKYYLC